MIKRDKKGRFLKRIYLKRYNGYGIWYGSQGYPLIVIGNKDIMLHVYIWEKTNGLKPKGYHIHHIDGNKKNYKINNLILITHSDHRKLHAGWIKENEIWIKKPCNECNKLLPLYDFYSTGEHNPRSLCKRCEDKKNKKYVNKNIERIQEYRRQRYLKKTGKLIMEEI